MAHDVPAVVVSDDAHRSNETNKAPRVQPLEPSGQKRKKGRNGFTSRVAHVKRNGTDLRLVSLTSSETDGISFEGPKPERNGTDCRSCFVATKRSSCAVCHHSLCGSVTSELWSTALDFNRKAANWPSYQAHITYRTLDNPFPHNFEQGRYPLSTGNSS